MSLRRYLGLLYGILVLLIVAIGSWWVIFLSHEGRSYERLQRERMAAELASATNLIRTVPDIQTNPRERLAQIYPDLLFQDGAEGPRASIDPAAIERVVHEARRRQRMFTAEGIFFLALLAAGTVVLTLAYRSERDFRRARELFLAGATHELKTPLASLRLYTETLGRSGLDRQEADRIRSRMLEDIQRLAALIEQILALGYDENAGRSSAETLDLAEEMERLRHDMKSYLDAHGAQLTCDLPAGHRVRAPRSVLALVVRNLVTNAVNHAPAPGKIVLSLSRDQNWQRLAISDSGPGIPRARRKRIFSGSIRQDEPGAGLGLYLVKRQTELMGGRIELVSEEGRGSTFSLLLPASDKESA